jgi:hypothetical protein
VQELPSIVSKDGARRIIFCESTHDTFSFWEEVLCTDNASDTRWIPNSLPDAGYESLDLAIRAAKASFKWAQNSSFPV